MDRLRRGGRDAMGRGAAGVFLAGLCLLLSPAASAFGFGELLSQSPLGRPLDVVFPVLLDESARDAAPLPSVSIASDMVYAALGTQRPDLLNGVSITLEPAGAQVLVHVRTERRVLEPYLPLIVDLALPSGVLRHRYDLLLDPVTENTAEQAAQPQPEIHAIAVSAPAVAASTATAGGEPATAITAQAPTSRKQAQAEAKTVGGVAASAAGEPTMFRLDYSLHTPIPPLAASATSASPALPAAVPEHQPPPQADQSAMAQPAPAAEASRHSYWLDLIVVLLVLWGIRQAWLSGVFGARFGHPRSAGRADQDAAVAHYMPMPGLRRDSRAAAPKREPYPASTVAAPAVSRGMDRNGPAPQGDAGSGHIPFVAPSPAEMKPVPRPPERHEGIEVIDASGFYDEIATLLEQTLQREPRRLDLYSKLIEVYVAAGKPRQGLHVRRQLEALRHSPVAGIDNEDLLRVLRQAEEMLPPELSAGEQSGGLGAAAAPGSRWTRYYEGPRFESLEQHLVPLRAAYAEFRKDTMLQQTLVEMIDEEVGRPTPLQPALQFSRRVGGAQVYFKREDLRLDGSERIVNLIGQMLLMRSMGKLGVAAAASASAASATVAAAKTVGMPCTLYMPPDELDTLDPALLLRAQKYHVEFLPAADAGDARRDALACWLENPERLGYVTGLRAGPDPFPSMVMDFAAVVGHESRRQLLRYNKQDPAAIVGSAFGGFSCIGFVKAYLDKPAVRIVMTDPPAGFVPDAQASAPPPGVAGFELALREQRWLHASGRVEYLAVDAAVARAARLDCDKIEEFMPRPGDAAAIGMGLEIARTLPPSASVIVLLSAFGA